MPEEPVNPHTLQQINASRAMYMVCGYPKSIPWPEDSWTLCVCMTHEGVTYWYNRKTKRWTEV